MGHQPVEGLRGDWPEGLHRLLRESVADAILFLDRQGQVLACNAAAERLLGYRADELRGVHFCRLFFRPEEARRGEPEYELHAAKAHGRVAVARWYARQDGTASRCVGVTAALRDRSGQVRAFAQVLQDLTGQKLGEWRQERRRWAEGSSRDVDALAAAAGCPGYVRAVP